MNDGYAYNSKTEEYYSKENNNQQNEYSLAISGVRFITFVMIFFCHISQFLSLNL